MKTKPPIRIIKREQREEMSHEAKACAQNKESAGEATREIKSTVSTWVRDFKQRSRVNSRLAFQSLFKDSMSPLGKHA